MISSTLRKMAVLLALTVASPLFGEKANVFFIHGANVSLEDEVVWADAMFKRLTMAGANMEFCPVSWESDIGPSYNYQQNVSNAFETAKRLAPMVNSVDGRRVVIAHSLGTMVAASAIQDYGMKVDKLILINSAIPSEAFDPALANVATNNSLVHDDWREYPSACWASEWHKLFPEDDARHNLSWRGRFKDVARVAVNFYSSGDEVLELYSPTDNPSWYNGFSPSGNWGERYSWHKQEIYKGRKSTLGFIGTTDWSGWGFATSLGFKVWSASKANAVTDTSVFATKTVFNAYPESITNAVATRLESDYHLAQGIPALSQPTGRTNLAAYGIESYDMNERPYKVDSWPRSGSGALDNRFLHSDIKNVAYWYIAPVFRKIVEVGGLK